ncbi:hypothetical protein EYF80_057762 [Liparis tanakae]|uniref:Uncharacterized protein n=1 Tax=Liparis tanakae TaxID=230148 RepID=A0A4Z2ET24_9TELE|nr:hypothetical protein EYF80_057762 [Liparis tanakae]
MVPLRAKVKFFRPDPTQILSPEQLSIHTACVVCMVRKRVVPKVKVSVKSGSGKSASSNVSVGGCWFDLLRLAGIGCGRWVGVEGSWSGADLWYSVLFVRHIIMFNCQPYFSQERLNAVLESWAW